MTGGVTATRYTGAVPHSTPTHRSVNFSLPPHTRSLDDQPLTANIRLPERVEHPADPGAHGADGCLPQPHHDDSGRRANRCLRLVSKPLAIHGDKHSAIAHRSREHLVVIGPGQPDLADVGDVMAVGTEQGRESPRQVFIEEQPQLSPLSQPGSASVAGLRALSLPARQAGGVAERCPDVALRKLRVGLEDRLNGLARGKEIKNHMDRHTRALDCRLSTTNSWVDCNSARAHEGMRTGQRFRDKSSVGSISCRLLLQTLLAINLDWIDGSIEGRPAVFGSPPLRRAVV